MPNADEAQKAIDALNKTELEGRALAVNEARPKEEYKKNHQVVAIKAVTAVAAATTEGGGGSYNKGGYGGGDGGYKKDINIYVYP